MSNLRFTGRRGKWSGRGRGGNANVGNPALSAGGRETTNPARLRPTHFLALPLITHPSLMADIKHFQRGLFSNADGLNDSESASSPAPGKGSKVVNSSLVEGLDSSILIDPRRLHMTLGVMALEQDTGSVEMSSQGLDTRIPTIIERPRKSASIMMPTTKYQPSSSRISSIEATSASLLTNPLPTTPLDDLSKKTVSTALCLLNSLKPRISEILNGDKGIKIPLEVMHVLKPQKMVNTKAKKESGGRKEEVSGERNEVCDDGNRVDHLYVMQEKEAIGAGVLYIAPEMKKQNVDVELRKLIQISDFVHQAFKDAGYITDTRPLKLHCTILNASHRKSRTRQPFSYSDILVSDALGVLIADREHKPEVQERDSSRRTPSMSTLQPRISSSNFSPEPSNATITSRGHSVVKNPPSVSVNFGVFVVEEIQLWVMGSHGPNNEYINCGGVVLE